MKSFFLLFTVIFCCISTASAKSWRVNNIDATADFHTLDEALEGISEGDILYLEGSSTAYTLSSPIIKKVTIIGPGYFLAENPNTNLSKSPAFINSEVHIAASGTVFEGVSLNNIYAYNDLIIGADNVEIRRCYLGRVLLSNNTNEPLQINNAIIMQNYITGRIMSSSDDYAYNALITNNIFTTSSTASISDFRKSVIENNTFSISYSIGYNSNCIIQNNVCRSISTNPDCTIANNYIYSYSYDDFIGNSSTDGQWQLTEISPGRTEGINGSQCGAFGGSTPYVLSGLASVPHIYEIDAPSAASETDGLKVTIKIGTEK